jgi:hypothetical protein
MAGPIKIDWHKVKEIPLAERDWKSIKLYFDQANAGNFLDWENCIYLFRLSPPFCIKYNDEQTPLIYIGSGAIKQRWATHRDWLAELGATLPGARYEVWIAQHLSFREIEADALYQFKEWCRLLPLVNRKAANPAKLLYGENEIESIVEYDKRYSWALYPMRADLEEYYYVQSDGS